MTRVDRGAAIALALLLVASQAVLVWRFGGLSHDRATSGSDIAAFVALLMVPAGLGFLVLVRLVQAPATLAALLVVIGAGLLMRLVHFGASPILEDDHYRYLWDGAMVAHGFNPYQRAPLDILRAADLTEPLAMLAREGRGTLSLINFPELRSIYPGAAQVLFGLAHALLPWSLDGLRLVAILCEFATLVLLLVLLARLGRSLFWVAAYWLNPLVVLCLAGQAHIDVALPPLLLATVLAVQARHGLWAGALLGIAVGVKIWPVLLVPLIARGLGSDRRTLAIAAAAFAATSLLVLAPLLLSTLQSGSGLVAYAAAWANNNAAYAWAAYGLGLVAPAGFPADRLLRLVLAGAVGAVALAVALRPMRSPLDMIPRALVVTATLFYLSPAQFPWYAAWFLPFAVLTGNRPLLAATVLLPIYFVFFPLANAERMDTFLYGVAFLHAVPVLAWLGWSALTARRSEA